MKKAIELLTYWEQFHVETQSDNMQDFAQWLHHQGKKGQPEINTDQEGVNRGGLDTKTAYLLGGLFNFINKWMKLTFRDIPIVSFEDFGILKTIEAMGTPTKKMIVESFVMEPSTCFEVLKRMKRDGLIEDFADEQDKRVHRVSLTETGKNITDISTRKMTALASLLVGNLSEMEKKNLLPVLDKLNRFHDKLHAEKSREEIIDRFKL